MTVESQPPLVDLCCDNHRGLAEFQAPEKFSLEKEEKHLLCHAKKSASYTLALMQCTNGNTIDSVHPVSTRTSTCVCRLSQDQSCCHLPERSPVAAAQSTFPPRENRILALLIKMPEASSNSSSTRHGNASVSSGNK